MKNIIIFGTTGNDPAKATVQVALGLDYMDNTEEFIRAEVE